MWFRRSALPNPASLPLATALTNTGASDVIANAIITVPGGTTNPWIISIVFVLVCFICTQFLSHTGCTQVFTPLALMVCVKPGMNPIGIMGLVKIGCTASCLTPMANPGIPLIMASGGYSLKDCIKIGILPGLLICAVGVIWCSLFFHQRPVRLSPHGRSHAPLCRNDLIENHTVQNRKDG